MFAARLALVAPLVALAGCWPFLADPYEEYLDTDEREGTNGEGTSDDASAYFVGDILWYELRGGYWADSADGDLNGAQYTVTFIESGSRSAAARWAGGIGRCGSSDAALDYFETGVQLGGPASITGTWTQTQELAWGGDGVQLWGVALGDGTSFGHRVDIGIEAFSTDLGEVETQVLVETPRRLRVDSPDITGAEPPTASLDPLRLELSNTADVVLIRVIPQDLFGNSLGDVTCAFEGGLGTYEITTSMVPELGGADATIVLVGSVTNGSGEVLPGVPNNVAAIYFQQGYITGQ